MLTEIERRLAGSGRIDVEQAAWLYEHAEDADLRRLASQVRARYHAPAEATYLVMAIVNYTNVCVARCDYCSFYRLPRDPDTYLLTFEQVCERIDAMRSFGGTLVGFNGGFHPKLRLSVYADLFGKVRAKYPKTMDFYELTVAEFMYYVKAERLSYADGAAILKAGGTRWVTGGGAEILDDRFRQRHSPLKYEVEDYFTAQQAILDAGLGSTATMVIGFDESLDERLSHLARLRRFQDERGGLPSFLCWTYKPWGNDLGGVEVSSQEYLRWLAVSRIFLDNIRHVRTSVLTKNEDALLGLQYGANDFDLPTEDEVTQKAGATISHSFDQLLDACRRAGFEPRHRAPLALDGTVTYVPRPDPVTG